MILIAGATPLPMSLTDHERLVALLLILRIPRFTPSFVGVQATSRSQLFPGANSPTHSLEVTINPALIVGFRNLIGFDPA